MTAGGPLERLASLIAGSPHNLVSAREREVARLVGVHFAEAQAVGHMLDLRPGQRWLDLGTGGGIPGLVLALRYPGVEWVLLDSVGKKAEAVRGFAASLDLRNVVVVAGRAEAVARDPAFRATFDGVVARAVARLVVLVELARGFVRRGGTLAAIKGPSWGAELAEARWALQALGWRDVASARVAGVARPTWLVTMRSSGTPPAGVPREPGVPAKRPLRGSTSNPKPQPGSSWKSDAC